MMLGQVSFCLFPQMPPRRSSRQRRPTPRADALCPAASHLMETSTSVTVAESSAAVAAESESYQNNAENNSGKSFGGVIDLLAG